MHAFWSFALACLLVSGASKAEDVDPVICPTVRDLPADDVWRPERPDSNGDEGRSTKLTGIDADGDGRADDVILWQSYSESRFPGDPQEVVYTPTGSGKTYKASFARLIVLRRGNSYYVQGQTYESPQLPKPAMFQVDILKLGKAGLEPICTRRDRWLGND